MNFKSTLNEYPTHNTWVMVLANINGVPKQIMALYECISIGDKLVHEFKDYRDQKLFHCKCHPIEWGYVTPLCTATPTKSKKAKTTKTYFTPEYFGLRAFNVLTSNGIETIEELCKYTPKELLSLRGMGITSLDAILEELDFLDKELKQDEEL